MIFKKKWDHRQINDVYASELQHEILYIIFHKRLTMEYDNWLRTQI